MPGWDQGLRCLVVLLAFGLRLTFAVAEDWAACTMGHG